VHQTDQQFDLAFAADERRQLTRQIVEDRLQTARPIEVLGRMI